MRGQPGLAEPPAPAQELGVPVTAANRIGFKTRRGFGPEGHDLLCWTTTAESGGHFCAMDIQTGKVYTHPLNHMEAYPIVFGSDGCVYTGSTSGEVLRWNPKTNTWGAIGKPLFAWPGASLNHVRCLCEGRDKWLYAGSVYGERARIHIETGEVQKLPATPETGNWYVASAETLPDGRIAFGYGHAARIFIYGPAQGKDVGQWLPSDWTQDGFVLNMLVAKSVLYATHFPSGRRGAFDLQTGKFLGLIPWPESLASKRWSIWGWGAGFDFYVLPGTDTAVACDGKVIYQYDPRRPDLPPTLPMRDFRPPPDLELAMRYDVTTDCRVLVYDRLHKKVVRSITPEQPAAARNLFSLGVGPDGKVYGGAYQSTQLFRYDPKSGELAMLGDHHPGWSGETFSYAVWKDELITASYTNGAVVAYNPKKPWKAQIGKMINPRRVGFLGQRVYRPLSICVAEGGKIWAVGPAGWGTTGGGIAWIDPRTGKTEATPLPDGPQDIVPLPGNRLLFLSAGRLRWWDGTTNREIASALPPGAFVSIEPLEPGRIGTRFLCATANELLIVSAGTPGKADVEKRIPSPIPCARALVYDGQAIVGGVQGFAVVDLQTGTTDHFCSTPLGLRWAFVVAQGAVYFHSGPQLRKAPLPGRKQP
jgi:hypothetical protein